MPRAPRPCHRPRARTPAAELGITQPPVGEWVKEIVSASRILSAASIPPALRRLDLRPRRRGWPLLRHDAGTGRRTSAPALHPAQPSSSIPWPAGADPRRDDMDATARPAPDGNQPLQPRRQYRDTGPTPHNESAPPVRGPYGGPRRFLRDADHPPDTAHTLTLREHSGGRWPDCISSAPKNDMAMSPWKPAAHALGHTGSPVSPSSPITESHTNLGTNRCLDPSPFSAPSGDARTTPRRYHSPRPSTRPVALRDPLAARPGNRRRQENDLRGRKKIPGELAGVPRCRGRPDLIDKGARWGAGGPGRPHRSSWGVPLGALGHRATVADH